MSATIHHGDCLDVLRGMPDNSVDAVVCDPPYGLSNTTPEKVTDTIVRWAQGDREAVPSTKSGFMGAEWDAFVPPPAVWDECFRVLKPGGHLLAFAGARTQDLMGISVRMAGFDIRDSISWIAGSGFPKSHNIGKSTGDPRFDGWGTALKPAVEPVICARKPFKGTVAANTQEHGTGGINIDACRIGRQEGDRTEYGRDRELAHANTTASLGKFQKVTPYTPNDAGRWPANVVLDPDAAAVLDQQSGTLKSGDLKPYRNASEAEFTQVHITERNVERKGDSGGASRFFKVVEPDPPFMYAAKAPKKERPSYVNDEGKTVQHSTVKPLSICRWLVRLCTPEGGTVLDPFAGSGTTVEAAILEGFNVIGIEREAEYLPLIQQRINRATPGGPEPTETDLLDLITGDAA